MNITASYSETGMIDAAIDGVDMVVPDDMENRHRVMIAEWEAEGNIITPYEAPAASVPDRVTARQFKLHLLSSGYLDDVCPTSAPMRQNWFN